MLLIVDLNLLHLLPNCPVVFHLRKLNVLLCVHVEDHRADSLEATSFFQHKSEPVNPISLVEANNHRTVCKFNVSLDLVKAECSRRR